jgi:hypothetical protein
MTRTKFVDEYEYLYSAERFRKKLQQDKPSPEQLGELFQFLTTSNYSDKKEKLSVLLDHAEIPNISQLFQSAMDSWSFFHINELKDLSFLIGHEKNPVDPNIFLQYVLSRHTTLEEEGKTKYDLVEKCLGKGAVIENRLTVFHDTGHAFVRLECSDCSKGKPVSMYVGFYPPKSSEDEESSLDVELSPTFLYAKSLGKKLPKLSGVGSFQIMSKKLAEVSGIAYILDGMSKRGYSTHIEGPSIDMSSRSFSTGGYSSARLRDIKQQSFNISAVGAKSVLDRVLYVTDKCDRDLHYRAFSNNCIDFAQDLYHRAGLDGDHLDVMNPSILIASGQYKFLKDVSSGKTNTGMVAQFLLATVFISMIVRLGTYAMSCTKTIAKAAAVKPSTKSADVKKELGLDRKPSAFISPPDKTPAPTKTTGTNMKR